MAFDAHLAVRVRRVLASSADVRERRMFGGLAFLIGGHVGCGILGDRLMVRIAPESYEEALSRAHVLPMDFTGRPMRGFIYVEPAGVASEQALAHWVQRGAALAASLPAK